MGVRNIKKQLAGEEDLLLGSGTEVQERHSGLRTVTKLNLVKVIDEALQFEQLDSDKFKFAVYKGKLYGFDEEQVSNHNGEDNYFGWVKQSETSSFSSLDELPSNPSVKIAEIVDPLRGGLFYYDDSKKDEYDGGTVFNGWVRVFDSYVKVTWFGAIGDGVVDDTAAFKAAIATKWNVFVPAGKYNISDTLELNYGQRLFGDKQKSYLYQNEGAVPLVSAKGTVGDSATVSGVEEWQNWCNVDDPSLFSTNRVVMLKSTINALTDEAGSMRLGFMQNDSQIVPFTEYLYVRNIEDSKITFTEDTVFNLYPDGSKLYNMYFTRVFIDGLHIVKNVAGTVISLDYNENSVVSNNIIYSRNYSGAAVWCEHSLKVDIRDNVTYLDPDTVIKYGDLNDDTDMYGNYIYDDYYKYNTFKIVSSQQCNIIGNEINHGSQCIDITYTDAPSIFTLVQGNVINSARYNMATSHWGSFGNVFDGNMGNYCQEGIAARSRNDVVTNNTIIGSREAVQDTPEKENYSYGIYMGTGWTVNGIIANNVIHGFYRGVYVTQSSRGGFAWQRVKVTANDIRYCSQAVRVHRYANDDIPKDKSMEVYIAGNYIKANRKSSLYIPYGFTNGIQFVDNHIVDRPSVDGTSIVSIAANCKDIVIKGNIFPTTTDYMVRHLGMTEDVDGNDTSTDKSINNPYYAQLQVVDNIIKGGGEYSHNSNPIRFYDSVVGYKNLIDSNGVDYHKFYSEDEDLYATVNVINVSYDYENLDGASIHNIYPLMEGAEISIFGSSSIKLVNDGNISLGGASEKALSSSAMTKLVCYSSKWYIVA